MLRPGNRVIRPADLSGGRRHGSVGRTALIMSLTPFLRDRGDIVGLLSPTGSAMAAAWSRDDVGPVFNLEPSGLILDARNEKGDLTPWRVMVAGVQLTRRAASITLNTRRFNADVIVANSFWSHFDASVAGRLARRQGGVVRSRGMSEGLAGNRTALRRTFGVGDPWPSPRTLRVASVAAATSRW